MPSCGLTWATPPAPRRLCLGQQYSYIHSLASARAGTSTSERMQPCFSGFSHRTHKLVSNKWLKGHAAKKVLQGTINEGAICAVPYAWAQ
jgi:hypothetical protein